MTEENQAARFFNDMAASTEKLVKAMQLFGQTKDEDVTIGTTPKHLVMRRDKVELFRYEPMAEATATTPVLLAYGLIGRYTMADLQPDRSLVRSLLSKGLDLWLIDWGQPGGPSVGSRSMTTWTTISTLQSIESVRKRGTIRLRFSGFARAAYSQPAMPPCIPRK